MRWEGPAATKYPQQIEGIVRDREHDVKPQVWEAIFSAQKIKNARW